MQKKRIFIVLSLIILIYFFLILILPFIDSAIFQSQPNATSGKDTYIKESTATNYGAQSTIKIGKIVNGLDHRGLIEFNVSNISSGNTIVSAKMQVYVNSTSGYGNRTIIAYRITSPWTETEANWTSSNSSASWTSQGGDYLEQLDFIVFQNSSYSTGQYYNFTITQAVRGWINESYNNYGIILISNDSQNGNFTDLESSDSETESRRPRITIDYVSNAVPTIINFSTNSSLTSPKQVGENITFTVNWNDLESDSAQVFICNSSSINTSGCASKTFCNTSLQSSSPSSCSYTINLTDNRTSAFYIGVCDSGSNNCSEINQSSFYMNHIPLALVIQPNGGETINQSQGNYTIKFNVSDGDSDYLTGNIYYSTIQNSTTNSIASNLNLTQYCTDSDSDTSTANNCSYSWNSTNIYGTYYLAITLNDSFIISNDSSNSAFNVRSLTDSNAPNITSQWIDSDISSGEVIRIYANVSEPNINTVWVSINTTPQTNLTMSNSSSITFNVSWTAVSVGNYQFKVYANDTVGNLNNSMSWQNFTIRKPNATAYNQSAPSTALPFSLIKITSQLNTTDSLRDVYAYLNTQEGFSFLLGYSQNSSIGNFTSNQTKTATWFVSVPLSEATYTLNVTYTDYYSNEWNSSNFNIQVTSAVGGGYFLTVSGYPEVQTSSNYYAESYFTQSGSYSTPDSIKISLYDPVGNLITGPVDMTLKSTGIYNYTYSVPSSATTGQWETRVNATKSSTNYLANQFWKLVGALFDIGTITVINSNVNSLNISVIVHNNGTASTDLTLSWNLTRTDNNQVLDSGGETFAVSGGQSITKYYSPSTTYTGNVKITFLGRYSGTETAGAYKIFTTASEETPAPVSGGGGGGGGAAIEEKKADFAIKTEKTIYLTKNIEKTIILEINNTGKKDLHNISLELENLNKNYYSLSPEKIILLKQGKTNKFEIKFLIKDFIGENDFNYLIKTNELTKRESGKIIVLEMKNYFLEKAAELEKRVKEIKNQTDDEKLLNELLKCEKIIEDLKLDIEKEEFINAKDNIKKADICIDSIKNKIKEKEREISIPTIKMEYWVWIITWMLIIILIAVLSVIVYILYRKLGIMSFLNKESESTSSKKRAVKKEYIEKKIKNIEEKLKK